MTPIEERFWPKVDKTETCWLWTGAIANGYGWFKAAGRQVGAHRFAYERLIGPVPDGLNTLRGTAPTADNARKTRCSAGHPLAGDNLITRRNGKRACRECNNRWSREAHRKRAARART